jgi:arylsulfatase A-like enzyme
MRIPFLIRYPPLVKRGTKINDMVLNIDLAPTFLELAGIQPPGTMQGASWVPLFRGQRKDWRDAFMFEYFFEPNLPATPAMVAVRTPRAKLIVYPQHPDWVEMFDLRADPYETRNLAGSPKHARLLKTLQAELADQKERFGEPFVR